MTLPPLSLYVHIPWCVRKCPYCDFNSHQSSVADIPEQAYLSALKQDLNQDLAFVQGRSISSIFFGGGTPSLMSGEFYTRLLEHLDSVMVLDPSIEITLEANPGTTEASRFENFRQAGINRLSLGVQSFADRHLKALGRIHNARQASEAILQAKAAGFQNFNIDLMHGLPEQDIDQAMADLSQAIDLGPTHISWYQLTIEPNTEFYSRPPVLPEDELLWDIQSRGTALLESAGYKQYEVSAFAATERRSRHNLNYWQFGDYIGIGAGAHSKVSLRDSKCILRYRKSRLPKDYLAHRPLYRVGDSEVPDADLPFEFLMNALRLKDGVDAGLFEQRTGLPLSELEPQLGTLREQGLMLPGRLQLSGQGFLFLNAILERFVQD